MGLAGKTNVHVLLMARQLSVSDSAFCTGFFLSWLKVPEQALDGIPIGLGMAIKTNLKL